MIKRVPRRKAASGGAGATLAVLLLCCGGGLLSLDDDDANETPYRQSVLPSKIVTPVTPVTPVRPVRPVTPEPTTESRPSESSGPEETPTPTPTVDTREASCVTRSERSAAMVYFAEDYSDICAYVPDYDFGVSAKDYGRCVKKSRKYHVEKYMYESTCRYNHTYKWTATDDPDHPYSSNVREYGYIPDVSVHNYHPSDPNRSYTPAIPDYDSTPTVPDYDSTPTVPDYGDDPGETDNGSGTPSDVQELNDDPHGGCTWVNSYHRKDGTYVSGYYRC